jgi:hypothetical protein
MMNLQNFDNQLIVNFKIALYLFFIPLYNRLDIKCSRREVTTRAFYIKEKLYEGSNPTI